MLLEYIIQVLPANPGSIPASVRSGSTGCGLTWKKEGGVTWKRNIDNAIARLTVVSKKQVNIDILLGILTA